MAYQTYSISLEICLDRRKSEMMTICKIVASTGVLLKICKIDKGRDIAIGSGVVAAVWEIIKAVI